MKDKVDQKEMAEAMRVNWVNVHNTFLHLIQKLTQANNGAEGTEIANL